MSPAFNRPAFMGVSTADIEAPQASEGRGRTARVARSTAPREEVPGEPAAAPAGEAALASADVTTARTPKAGGSRRAAARKRGKKRR